MSGRGKTGGKTRAKAKTRSSRAGLQFPVGRVHRLLRKGNYAQRVGAGARFIWPLYSSIWRLRSWSWLETPLGTTRRPVSSPVTCSWRCATTRSWTNSWAEWPSLRAAYCPTSRPCCCPRRPRNPAKPNKQIQVCFWNPKALLRAALLSTRQSPFC